MNTCPSITAPLITWVHIVDNMRVSNSHVFLYSIIEINNFEMLFLQNNDYCSVHHTFKIYSVAY